MKHSLLIEFNSREDMIAYLQGDTSVKVSGGNVGQTVQAKEAEVVDQEYPLTATTLLEASAKDAISMLKDLDFPESELRIAFAKESRTSVKKAIGKKLPANDTVDATPTQQQHTDSPALNAFNRDACINRVQQTIANLKTLGMQDDQIRNEVFVQSFQNAGLQPMRVTDLADSDLTKFYPAFKQVTDAKIAELQGAMGGQSAPQGGGSFI